MTDLTKSGVLELAGTGVTLGQIISRADIDSGLLQYIAPVGSSGPGADSMGFKTHDGTEFSASESTLAFDIAPTTLGFTLDVGPDQTVRSGEYVSLDASSTGQSSVTTSYQWQQISGPSVQLFGANTSKASFIAPEVGGTQVLVFEVINTDGTTVITDTITITILEELSSSDRENLLEPGPTREATQTTEPVDEEQAYRDRTVRALQAMNWVVGKDTAPGMDLAVSTATRSSSEPVYEKLVTNQQARSSSEPRAVSEGTAASLSEARESATEDTAYREEPTPTEEPPPNMWARLWLGMLAFFHNVPATRRRTGE